MNCPVCGKPGRFLREVRSASRRKKFIIRRCESNDPRCQYEFTRATTSDGLDGQKMTGRTTWLQIR